MNYTIEQEKIFKKYREGLNIYINAGPGCGKTTTTIELIRRNKKNRFIMITYNSRLKKEGRDKIEEMGLENGEAHSFHSLVYKYYSKGYNDENIKKVLNDNIELKEGWGEDTIIIDECQDMTYLYHKIIKKYMRDKKRKYQIIIIGDINQSIYGYKMDNNSDHRYLTLCEHIYKKYSDRGWEKLKLSESFRITKSISYFINKHIIENNIISKKEETHKVYYINCNIWRSIWGDIKDIIDVEGLDIKKNKIYVLGRTGKLYYHRNWIEKKLPVMNLLNDMSRENLQIYYNNKNKEQSNRNLECMANKVCFLTFHGSKGLECDISIIFGMDTWKEIETYQDMINERNCRYVGCSRSKKLLIIIKDVKNKDFHTISMDKLKNNNNVEYRQIGEDGGKNGGKKDKEKYETVTGITDKIEDIIMREIKKKIKIKKIKKGEEIRIRDILKQRINDKTYKEDVCALNGIFMGAYIEMEIKNEIRIIKEDLIENLNRILKYYEEAGEYIKKKERKEKERNHIIKKYDRIMKKREREQMDINEILKLCNKKKCYGNEQYFILKQIKRYDWIKIKDCEKIRDNFYNAMKEINIDLKKEDIEFEKKTQGKCEEYNSTIRGSIDIKIKDKVIELKMVNEILDKHILQAMLYGLMEDAKDTYIYNMKYDELIKIETTWTFEEVMKIIINYKIKKKFITDEEFIEINNEERLYM